MSFIFAQAMIETEHRTSNVQHRTLNGKTLKKQTYDKETEIAIQSWKSGF